MTLSVPYTTPHEQHTHFEASACTHLRRNAYIRHTDTKHNVATDGSASVASEIEVGSIYPTTQELRASPREEGSYVFLLVLWRGVGCGGWRGSPRTAALEWGAYKVELWMPLIC